MFLPVNSAKIQHGCDAAQFGGLRKTGDCFLKIFFFICGNALLKQLLLLFLRVFPFGLSFPFFSSFLLLFPGSSPLRSHFPLRGGFLS